MDQALSRIGESLEMPHSTKINKTCKAQLHCFVLFYPFIQFSLFNDTAECLGCQYNVLGGAKVSEEHIHTLFTK